MRVDFYCQDCDSEKFDFEIEEYPFDICPVCKSKDKEAIVWQRIAEPYCPECLNQNPIFDGAELLEKALPDYEVGTKLKFYTCSNCNFKYALSNDE